MAIIKEAGRIFRDPFPLRLKHDCCKKFYICSFFHDLSTRPSSKPIFRGGRLSIYRFHRSCLVGVLPSWTRCTTIFVSNEQSPLLSKGLKQNDSNISHVFKNLHVTSLGISAPMVSSWLPRRSQQTRGCIPVVRHGLQGFHCKNCHCHCKIS